MIIKSRMMLNSTPKKKKGIMDYIKHKCAMVRNIECNRIKEEEKESFHIKQSLGIQMHQSNPVEVN